MTVGTKSLLFGVHQFLWHPITVLLAWRRLYGCPGRRELICIFIHDWGYWCKRTMDGKDGITHPRLGARIAFHLLGRKYSALCLLHSRNYAGRVGKEPSKLCWVDKLSITYDPWWFYLLRAWLSGELVEYRRTAAEYVDPSANHRQWYSWLVKEFKRQALSSTI